MNRTPGAQTLRQAFDWGTALLEKAGVEEASLDARYLLLHAFEIDTVHYLMDRDCRFLQTPETKESLDRYEAMIARRVNRFPLQYIIGSREFMGLDFFVNSHVLIPRQDTETLVEQVLADHPEQDVHVLDLCTGSGCIAVSLAVLGNYRQVLGTDLSKEALKVAAMNSLRLCESGRPAVEWLLSDLFQELGKRKFQIIVSNPPYIPTAVICGLEPEVREFEPKMALDGQEDGLSFYRRIAAESGDYLSVGGSLYLEIGFDQAGAVSELLESAGFREIKVIKDQAGLDRVVKAVWDRNEFQEVSNV